MRLLESFVIFALTGTVTLAGLVAASAQDPLQIGERASIQDEGRAAGQNLQGITPHFELR